ncbi:MAG: hypothetical protein Satyrvirus6_11 [Satyrvirus sp.]|uniref:Uncharacterized protein n=1 Tax=Satyrvirus sp. TaxID=2487771 RepID=A0A3G5AIE2_9VIRU|nr:MAG: hypothetical protein Satyrvirus6_11 [Satyrvirus sp.]
MEQKYNWIIVSGSTICIEYANIIKNKTKKELGNYIRNHISELYDHFLFMQEQFYVMPGSNISYNSNIAYNKIKSKMGDIPYVHGRDIFKADTKNKLSNISEIINKNLQSLSDEEIVDEFPTYDSNLGRFCMISKLKK